MKTRTTTTLHTYIDGNLCSVVKDVSARLIESMRADLDPQRVPRDHERHAPDARPAQPD